jgi:hypothetical protein
MLIILNECFCRGYPQTNTTLDDCQGLENKIKIGSPNRMSVHNDVFTEQGNRIAVTGLAKSGCLHAIVLSSINGSQVVAVAGRPEI